MICSFYWGDNGMFSNHKISIRYKKHQEFLGRQPFSHQQHLSEGTCCDENDPLGLQISDPQKSRREAVNIENWTLDFNQQERGIKPASYVWPGWPVDQGKIERIHPTCLGVWFKSHLRFLSPKIPSLICFETMNLLKRDSQRYSNLYII